MPKPEEKNIEAQENQETQESQENQETKKDEQGQNKEEKIEVKKADWNQMYARTKKAEQEIAELRNAKDTQEEEKLKKEQKWEELIAKKDSEIERLKPLAEMTESLQSTVEAMAQSEIYSLPEDIRTLIPDSMGAKEKLDYIRQNKSIFSKFNSEIKKPTETQDRVPASDNARETDDLSKSEAEFQEIIKEKREKGIISEAKQKRLAELSRHINKLKSNL